MFILLFIVSCVRICPSLWSVVSGRTTLSCSFCFLIHYALFYILLKHAYKTIISLFVIACVTLCHPVTSYIWSVYLVLIVFCFLMYCVNILLWYDFLWVLSCTTSDFNPLEIYNVLLHMHIAEATCIYSICFGMTRDIKKTKIFKIWYKK